MSDEKNGQTGGKDMKDVWFHDENMPQEEVDFMNAALMEASKVDPRWAKLIWIREPQNK